jgi:acetate CoA/acetoacetate CoA-transferase alpha subunit
MAKIITVDEAAEHIKDGMSVMIAGFMGCGNPHSVIDALVRRNAKELTIICNDAAWPGFGLAKLITNKQVKKLIATHVGLNKEVGQKMNSGELEVELIPQGTFAERIRCGGNGMGGFLTPTGLGTLVAEGKQVINLNGRDILLELPLRADAALLVGYKVDRNGNVWYKGNTRTFNVVMATAADLVIVEADNIVELGEIEPENVVTQGIFIDYIADPRRGWRNA